MPQKSILKAPNSSPSLTSSRRSLPSAHSSLPLARFFPSLRLFLFYSFPVVLYFSYYPLLSLGSSASMNFELSLPLLWLLLFSLLSLKDFFALVFRAFRSLAKHSASSDKSSLAVILPLLFPLYLSLSILWSPNPLRALLTSGILWCIYISIYALLSRFSVAPSSCSTQPSASASSSTLSCSPALLLKTFLFGSAAVCLFCWAQCLLDVFGISRETSLLCLGCTYRSFGFPHPSGFAIEPQFMGNLLLAPAFLSLYLLQNRTGNQKTEQIFKNRTFLPALSFLFLSTLFLTFSRGAIYSFAVAYLLFLILSVVKLQSPAVFKSLPLVIAAFLFSLASQGTLSALSPTSDTFLSGIEKSISQLSLGQINLRLSPQPSLPEQSASSTNPQGSQDSQDPQDTPATTDASDSISPEPPSAILPVEAPPADLPASSLFSGYVAESTDVRLRLNSLALEASLASPASFLFGYGLGSAGAALFSRGSLASSAEIIQNEYLALLLETGILGLLLLALALLVFSRLLKNSLAPRERVLLFALLLSFALSLNFFSGLPNALHLYLFPDFLILLFAKHKPVIN